ncbi:MAG: acyl carrier protein [Planctomycetes bacterium]|nr:acyl carrier protein [Planctomycetota bacterium]
MDRFEAARAEILQWLSETVHTPVEQIDLTRPLTEIGLDSLDAVHMVATIESIIRRELPEDIMRRVKCLNDIFDLMREKLAAA